MAARPSRKRVADHEHRGGRHARAPRSAASPGRAMASGTATQIVGERQARSSGGPARARGAATSQISSDRLQASPWKTTSAAVWLMSTALGGRERDIGAGERRRVVEAVADHQDLAARAASASAARDLARPACSRRARSAMPSVAGDSRDRRRPIARQELDREASRLSSPITAAASARNGSVKAKRDRRPAGAREPQLRSRRPRPQLRRRTSRGCRARTLPPCAKPWPGTSRRRPATGAPAPRAQSARPADGGWRRRARPRARSCRIGGRGVERRGRASACRSCRTRPCRPRPGAPARSRTSAARPGATAGRSRPPAPPAPRGRARRGR